jgi:hypothetical protein
MIDEKRKAMKRNLSCSSFLIDDVNSSWYDEIQSWPLIEWKFEDDESASDVLENKISNRILSLRPPQKNELSSVLCNSKKEKPFDESSGDVRSRSYKSQNGLTCRHRTKKFRDCSPVPNNPLYRSCLGPNGKLVCTKKEPDICKIWVLRHCLTYDANLSELANDTCHYS